MTRALALNLVALAFFASAGTLALATDNFAPATDAGYATPLSAMAQLGRKLFFDPSLSASGRQACSTCHDPKDAYAPDNDLAVQRGGPDLKRPGLRAVPSLGYMNATPVFGIGPESLFETDPPPIAGPASTTAAAPPLARTSTGQSKAQMVAGAIANPVPEGGFFWDGRSDTLEEQTTGPLLSPFEMANTSTEAVVAKLRAAPYAGDFTALFGAHSFDDPKLAMSEASFALARYETEDPRFHPFTSKYDAYLAGRATLSPEEAEGLKLFDDPNKGNCSSCHLDKPDAAGHPPLFTDFEYEALGVPRNPAIPANADPNYFDLGICGPLRHDAYAHQDANCALFKTPTLRNVATRHAFFHNGVFHNLEDVLHWYVGRDTNPEKFYPRAADGSIDKFNDVPPRYRANIDVIDAPFNRHPGEAPALNDREIKAVIAFLKTLTDGYTPTGHGNAAATVTGRN